MFGLFFRLIFSIIITYFRFEVCIILFVSNDDHVYISSLPNKMGSSQRPAEKGVISTPSWKRGHLNARLEKESSQRPVEKGRVFRKSFISLYRKIITV